MNMETWDRTRLWDEGESSVKEALCSVCRLDESELPILYAYLGPSDWTLVTTRRIWHSVNDEVGSVAASDVVEHHAGNFKGYGQQDTEIMTIRDHHGEIHRCPFETGKASMGIIYAVQTLCNMTGAA